MHFALLEHRDVRLEAEPENHKYEGDALDFETPFIGVFLIAGLKIVAVPSNDLLASSTLSK